MKLLDQTLASLIRRGKVTVEIPGLEPDRLYAFLRCEAARTLQEIAAVACAEEMSDAEKAAWIQERLN